jgi:hypothetical protein
MTAMLFQQIPSPEVQGTKNQARFPLLTGSLDILIPHRFQSLVGRRVLGIHAENTATQVPPASPLAQLRLKHVCARHHRS